MAKLIAVETAWRSRSSLEKTARHEAARQLAPPPRWTERRMSDECRGPGWRGGVRGCIYRHFRLNFVVSPVVHRSVLASLDHNNVRGSDLAEDVCLSRDACILEGESCRGEGDEK